MNNFGEILFCFLYRKIADIERNWSVADESSNVSDIQFPSDNQIIASTTIPSSSTPITTTTTTTFQNDTGRNENVENSVDITSIELSHHDSLRSDDLINTIDSSGNA